MQFVMSPHSFLRPNPLCTCTTSTRSPYRSLNYPGRMFLLAITDELAKVLKPESRNQELTLALSTPPGGNLRLPAHSPIARGKPTYTSRTEGNTPSQIKCHDREACRQIPAMAGRTTQPQILLASKPSPQKRLSHKRPQVLNDDPMPITAKHLSVKAAQASPLS